MSASSTSFVKKNSATIATLCTQRIAALKADVPAKTQIPINGTATTVANVIAIYQEYLDQQASLTAKRAEVKTAIIARDAALTACQATDTALTAWVTIEYGAGSQQAHDFGLSPRKTPVVSTAARALAVQKAAATRVARGTVGKKKKLAIKGTVPAVAASPSPAVPPPTVNTAVTHAS